MYRTVQGLGCRGDQRECGEHVAYALQAGQDLVRRARLQADRRDGASQGREVQAVRAGAADHLQPWHTGAPLDTGTPTASCKVLPVCWPTYLSRI